MANRQKRIGTGGAGVGVYGRIEGQGIKPGKGLRCVTEPNDHPWLQRLPQAGLNCLGHDQIQVNQQFLPAIADGCFSIL